MQLEKLSRVSMSPMWKHKRAIGTIIKVTKDYTVVKWDNIPGEWHYTHEQSKRLEKMDDA
jgi:hypothetical protein